MIDDGKIILVKDKRGRWSFPKGKYEKEKDGEPKDLLTLYECARREFLEETHMINFRYIYQATPLFSYTNKGVPSIAYFPAKITEKMDSFKILPVNDEEIIEVRLFTQEEFLALSDNEFQPQRKNLACEVLLIEDFCNEDIFIEDKLKTFFSKKMSWELRHNLTAYTSTEDGFVSIHDLITKINRDFREKITITEIFHIVKYDEKKRFKIQNDLIRANQGHSCGEINPDKMFTRITEPLEYCVHGTTRKIVKEILKTGIQRMGRKQIHMAISPNAISGVRKSCKVLLHINTEALLSNGFKLYLSDNDVALCEETIPPEFFTVEYL